MVNAKGILIWEAFLPSGVRLRRATLADRAVRAVLYSEMRARERYTAAGWSDALWEAFVADQFRLREVHYEATYPKADVLMIEARSGAGGRFATVGTVSVDLGTGADGAKMVRLITIELCMASRRRGIGTHVIEALVQAARVRGCQRMELSVARTNPDAERLYRRLGFLPSDLTSNAIVEAAGFQSMALQLGTPATSDA